MIEELVRLGARFKARREELGMSARELGARVGLSYVHIYRIEAGKVAPTWPNVVALCDALALDVAPLLRDEDAAIPGAPIGEERQLLDKIRRLDPDGQKRLLKRLLEILPVLAAGLLMTLAIQAQASTCSNGAEFAASRHNAPRRTDDNDNSPDSNEIPAAA